MVEPDDGEDNVAIGVVLTGETSVGDAGNDPSLGVVLAKPRRTTLTQLRHLLNLQLRTLPICFTFTSLHGCPVTKTQESTIRVAQVLNSSHILRLQRCYDKPRVGIKALDGTAIGFVFIEPTCSLSMLRWVIQQQLGNIGTDDRYQIVERNGWPVTFEQEHQLCVVDAMVAHVVRVCPPVFTLERTLDTVCSHTSQNSLRSKSTKRKRQSAFGNQLTFGSSKDADRQVASDVSEDTFEKKQILLSYVRAEASWHALALKEELLDLGFTVYLDVHEIKSGIDWQDALNDAVSNCEVFVPLVTQRYGETQWTNREVKLADVLSKQIVPVSFLDHWPPKCLAIQFATTQYIPWKGPEDLEVLDYTSTDSADNRYRDKMCRRYVAQQIGNTVLAHDLQLRTGSHAPLTKRNSVLRSYAATLPAGVTDIAQVAADRDGPPLIVISVHPKQQAFVQSLKALLEPEGYEVWCTMDLNEQECINMKESVDIPDTAAASLSFDTESSLSVPDDGKPNAGPCDCCCDASSGHSQGHRKSSQEDLLGPAHRDKLLTFQEKADEAGVVIFILSKAFAASRTCKQQVFYCEHRKRLIPLRFEEFCMPDWMSMLIGTGVFEDARAEGYEDLLKARVKRALDPTARDGSQGEIKKKKVPTATLR